ncbi:LysR family transcriptional regulator [Aeromonas salmonicida subsp. salmonicida]|nr:LysR family transcriptional regulator [Aeromonas salmonicida subsp. salmonicida]
MEFRYLRYLVAVAEKQSFTKAAEALGMAQPPLSQQIRKFEQEVGTPLFHRLTRSVELTEAGLSLYQDAKGILSQTEQAMQKAQRIARGQLGSLRLGFAGSTVLHPSVLRLIHDFRQAWPEVSLHPIENSMPNLVRDLVSEELDAAILRLPCSSSSALTHHLIDEEEMLIALPPHHPLASTGAIAIEALAQDPFILFPRELGPGLHDAITQRCQRAGFSPRLGSQSPQVISTVGMVQAGFGVAIIPRSISELHPHGVSYHPIADEPLTTRISLATRRHPRQKSLQHLIGLIPSRRDRHTDIASA